ncbi:MAG: hypothetical protein IKC64_03085 [Clostridia bacterium]|nr:hypothetical protein [Clostridia bacterium]
MIKFDKFPIGFWNYYPPFFKFSEEEVLRWKECGITLTISPLYEDGKTDKAQFIKMLDFCAEQGVRLILWDRRATVKTYLADKERYPEVFRSAVTDFGSHPAVVGFFIGDEPFGDAVTRVAETCKIQREIAPHLIPYTNFLPYYCLNKCNDFTLGKPFETWIDDFAKESQVLTFSYDCYVQMNPEKRYIQEFYDNLYNFTTSAKRNDKFLFNIILGVGHFRYRVPNEDELRWQFNASIVNGVNGIIWFTFYTPVRSNNYRGGAIDEFGEETETYQAMKRIHKKFHRDYADIVRTAKHIKTFSCGDDYGVFPSVTAVESELAEIGLHEFVSANKHNGLLGLFEDKNGEKFIMLFNNDYAQSDLFKITVSPKVKKVWRIYGEDKIDFEKNHWDAFFTRDSKAVTASVYLAPGQIEIFKLEY